MSWPERAWAAAAMVSKFLLPIEVMYSIETSTFSLAPHSSHKVWDALLAPGTQWSQNPIESLPAAWAPRTYGMAMTAVEVAARKRRRVILLLSMMQSSHWVPALAPPISAGAVARRPVQLHAVTGRKLRSNSPRLSVEISWPHQRHAAATLRTLAEIGTDRRSRRSVRQKAEPPLRRNEGSGVVTTS